jgi:hypothetical protein
VASGVIACLAAVHKGLDVTDESYYLLSYLHPKLYLRSSTDFQLVIAPVLSVVRYVWILRVVNLVALLSASAFFAVSFLKTAPSLFGARIRRSDRLAVGAAIVAGALMPSVYLPQTPGYNQLMVWNLLCTSSLLLLLADTRLSRAIEPVAWAAVGALTCMQLVVKWPAVAATIPLMALALWRTKPRLWSVPKCVAFSLAGLLLAALATELFVEPLPSLLRGLSQGSQDLATYGGHDTGSLLWQYVLQLRHLAWTIASSYWYLLLAAIIGSSLIALRRHARTTALVLGIGLFVLAPVLVAVARARGGLTDYGDLDARGSVLPALVMFAVVAGATGVVMKRRVPTDRKVLFVGSLLAIPFLSALGTNNYLWFNALFAASFWVAAALGITSVAFDDHSHFVVRGLAVAFAMLIAFTAADGTWALPYRQPPLDADTVAITIPGPLSGLQVDPATARFLEEVRASVQVAPGPPLPILVALAGVPGADVAGGVFQPVFAWVGQGTKLAALTLEKSCEDHPRGILLLEHAGGPDPLIGSSGLPATCSDRVWAKRTSIDVPWTAQLGIGSLELYYAGPVGIERTTNQR